MVTLSVSLRVIIITDLFHTYLYFFFTSFLHLHLQLNLTYSYVITRLYLIPFYDIIEFYPFLNMSDLSANYDLLDVIFRFYYFLVPLLLLLNFLFLVRFKVLHLQPYHYLRKLLSFPLGLDYIIVLQLQELACS